MARAKHPVDPNTTISIVDDDAYARQGIDDFVSSLGYHTLTFASAEDFMQSGCVGLTTCVITDLQMPGLNGLQLQERLAREGHRVSVIVLTAYPDEKSRAKAFNAGAFGFLTKPFVEKNLLECLEAAVAPRN